MIGKYLSIARKKAGFSRSELADLVALDDETIARYERNESEPKISLINKFAEVLNTSISSLMGEPSEGVTSVDVKGSNINGITTIGNNSKLINPLPKVENESFIVLVARMVDLIEKKEMKPHELDAIRALLKSGLETLETKKDPKISE